MGQKINPISLRLQNTNRYFDFCWYNDFFYSDLISQDLKIENYIGSIFKQLQYPLGRFYIQNSQKKIKLFAFFCSPKKARKKKANSFKLNYYKKNIYNLKNTKISVFLREKQNLQSFDKNIMGLGFIPKRPSQTYIPKIKESKKDIGIYTAMGQKKVNKNYSIYFEEKLIYMKYLLYRYYLQRFYKSKECTFYLPNWISFLKKKQRTFSKKSNNLVSLWPRNFMAFFNQKKILSYNQINDFDLKNIYSFFSYQSEYLQVNFVNRKLKKSKTLALTAIEPKKGRIGHNIKSQSNKNIYGNRKSTNFKGKFWNQKKLKKNL